MHYSQRLTGVGAAVLASSSLVTAVPTNATCLPIVKDQVLRDSITVENLYKHAEALEAIAYATSGRNRVAGSVGHNNTVEYIVSQLEALGDYYAVEVQPWSGLTQTSGDIVFSVNGKTYEAAEIEFSTNATIVETPLVVVPNLGCEATDFTDEALEGAVALIHRGSRAFAAKAALAGEAGALAVIFWNTEDALVAGTYGGFDETLPAGGGISSSDGEALVALASNTTLTVNLDIKTVIETVYSSNVIATSKYGDTDNILFLGAHSDSVDAGPGINDDGSGTIGILETAIQLSKYRTRSQVKFGWWTAEESGLLGSTYYVETLTPEELLKIRLYLNFDMIASPNFILGHYDGDGSEFGEEGPAGSAETEHFFEKYYESLGLNHTATEFNGRSDYGAFLESGVPCGGLDAGADEIKTEEWVEMFGGTPGIILDPNYHGPGDNVSNLNATCFEVMTKGIAHAVAEYAGSGFKGYPVRETPEKRSVAPRRKRGLERLYPDRFPVTV
jgi:carboxypeptidase Q